MFFEVKNFELQRSQSVFSFGVIPSNVEGSDQVAVVEDSSTSLGMTIKNRVNLKLKGAKNDR